MSNTIPNITVPRPDLTVSYNASVSSWMLEASSTTPGRPDQINHFKRIAICGEYLSMNQLNEMTELFKDEQYPQSLRDQIEVAKAVRTSYDTAIAFIRFPV